MMDHARQPGSADRLPPVDSLLAFLMARTFLALSVEIERGDVARRGTFDGVFLTWREFRLKLGRQSPLRFHFESRIRPQDRGRRFAPRDAASVRASINCALTRTRLPARCTLPSTHMGDAELLADLAQVAFASGLVLHDRSATDHFQVRDLREVG